MKRRLILNLMVLLAVCVFPLTALTEGGALAEAGTEDGAQQNHRVMLPLVQTIRSDRMQANRLDGRVLPPSVVELKLPSPVEMRDSSLDALAPDLFDGEGARVIVRLSADSVADARAKGRATAPGQIKKEAQAQQSSFLDRVLAADPSARVLGSVQVIMNAVFVEVDAAALRTLAEDPAVVRVTPVGEYEIDLHETVPYIGAGALHDLGYDGTGVRVAVLDSGVDYLHAALGGSGDPAEFAANDPTLIEPGTFPTAKVVDGYDFVGSNWAGSGDLEEPDPDPLDAGPGGGHGTHVADIIGGLNGVAPGVDLYAVKVCSSISTGCSGIAMIQGMEFAVDPNGDGDPADHVDLVNMSIGSVYGQPFDDDMVLAVNQATALGVMTVASAGNSGDKPYSTGTPGAALTALSVAQTSVPSAVLPFMEIVAPPSVAGSYPAIFQPWATPLTALIEAPLQYGDGSGGNLDGCAPFAPGSLTGKIVLVDRGACNFTLKIKNIGEGGGLVGIIGMVAPGDPFEGGDGGDRPIDIPGYMISQAAANALITGLPDTVVRFDPAQGVPLVGSMVGSSSRGPRNPDSFIKPEIGAPGASVSAIAGTGDVTGPFGGTSGAAPMATGSAALLMQAQPALSPVEVKARLMNNGETGILNDAVAGALAPVSRIGGGEVRVDQALAAPAAAWDADLLVGGLSFGFVDVAGNTLTLHRTVRVRNYTNRNLEYRITPTFRFDDDAATGAVTLSAPPKVKVRAGQDATFTVKMTIRGALLPANAMSSGSMGGDPAALTLNEFDGYLILDDGSDTLHLPWHVLPRKAAAVKGRPRLNFQEGVDTIALSNTGVGTAQNDAYALLALSPDLPEGGVGQQSPTPDIRGVGINTYPVPAGYCSAEPSFIWAFAINTWERQSHLIPVSHQIALDTNQDGTADYVVLNRDASGIDTISDGRQLAWAVNLAAGTASAYFYAEHATNTGNTVLLVCGEQVGLTGTDMLNTHVGMEVYAQDFYFGGPGDLVTGLVVTPYAEQYYGEPSDISGKSGGTMTVYDFGLFPGNTPELGLMLFTNGDRGTGNRGGATQATEAFFLRAH